MTSHSNLAFDEVPRGDGSTGATEQIARTLRESGVDAPAALFDEALSLARDGHLSPATERLRMLLCLDPTDSEASLLLGKILATRGQHQEALVNLDAAATHGAVLEPGLREQVEVGLRQQITEAEDHRARVAARERGEVHSLRSEAKKLRSENAALELDVDDLQRRVRLWSSTSAVIAGVAAALVLGVLLLGGGDTTDTPTTADSSGADSSSAALTLTPSSATVAATSGLSSQIATVAPATVAPAAPAPATVAPATVARAKVTPAVAPRHAATRVHVVKKNDTLGSIAKRYYGNSAAWPTIQKANAAQLGNGVKLKIGMKLTIPPAP
ncbi:MAG: LysM peptidoglycan-binding domain-containing protein [Oligoflexia bacterium]|nr:LysM peptidoglycan-binding domain-containing protein [Oligoflexia bacterium]